MRGQRDQRLHDLSSHCARCCVSVALRLRGAGARQRRVGAATGSRLCVLSSVRRAVSARDVGVEPRLRELRLAGAQLDVAGRDFGGDRRRARRASRPRRRRGALAAASRRGAVAAEQVELPARLQAVARALVPSGSAKSWRPRATLRVGVERRQQRRAGGDARVARACSMRERARWRSSGSRPAPRRSAARAADRRTAATSAPARRARRRAAAGPASGPAAPARAEARVRWRAGRHSRRGPGCPTGRRRIGWSSVEGIGRGDAASAAGAVVWRRSRGRLEAGALCRRSGECTAPRGPGFFGPRHPPEALPAASGRAMNRRIAASRLRTRAREGRR